MRRVAVLSLDLELTVVVQGSVDHFWRLSGVLSDCPTAREIPLGDFMGGQYSSHDDPNGRHSLRAAGGLGILAPVDAIGELLDRIRADDDQSRDGILPSKFFPSIYSTSRVQSHECFRSFSHKASASG